MVTKFHLHIIHPKANFWWKIFSFNITAKDFLFACNWVIKWEWTYLVYLMPYSKVCNVFVYYIILDKIPLQLQLVVCFTSLIHNSTEFNQLCFSLNHSCGEVSEMDLNAGTRNGFAELKIESTSSTKKWRESKTFKAGA